MSAWCLRLVRAARVASALAVVLTDGAIAEAQSAASPGASPPAYAPAPANSTASPTPGAPAAGGRAASPYDDRTCRYYGEYYRRYYPRFYPEFHRRYCQGPTRPPALPAGTLPAPPTGAPPGPRAPPPAPTPPEPPFFDLTGGSVFPLGLGAEIGLELPARILLRADLLWMPALYGSAIVAMSDAVGKGGGVLSQAVEDALADSFVFQLGAGWRPFADYGFELLAGYTGLVVAGEVDPAVVGEVVGGDLQERMAASLALPMPVGAHLHNFHVTLGWRFLAADDHLVVRLLVGYSQTVGTSSSLDVPEDPDFEAEVVSAFTSELDDTVTSRVKLPLLGLGLGYRF